MINSELPIHSILHLHSMLSWARYKQSTEYNHGAYFTLVHLPIA